MPATDSEEIVAGEKAGDEAEAAEAGETSEEVTSGVDLPPGTMMNVARHHVTTMIVGLPQGTMTTVMLLL